MAVELNDTGFIEGVLGIIRATIQEILSVILAYIY